MAVHLKFFLVCCVLAAAPLALGCRPGAPADPNLPAAKNREIADQETWDILIIQGD